MTISIDFETRSIIDLKKTGVYPYAQHPTTDVWCMAYAKDDGDVQVWQPGQPIPDVILNGAASQQFRAHNAQFERLVCSRILGMPVGEYLSPLLFSDTAAMAAILGYPRALGPLARALGVEAKDTAGTRLINLFCIH